MRWHVTVMVLNLIAILGVFVFIVVVALMGIMLLNRWQNHKRLKRANLIHAYLNTPPTTLDDSPLVFYMPFVGREDDALQIEQLRAHVKILIYEEQPLVTRAPLMASARTPQRLKMGECACHVVDHQDRVQTLWHCDDDTLINGKTLREHVHHLGDVLGLPVDEYD